VYFQPLTVFKTPETISSAVIDGPEQAIHGDASRS
jgi:hypothetical protein